MMRWCTTTADSTKDGCSITALARWRKPNGFRNICIDRQSNKRERMTRKSVPDDLRNHYSINRYTREWYPNAQNVRLVDSPPQMNGD
jgi:hypothetical protein